MKREHIYLVKHHLPIFQLFLYYIYLGKVITYSANVLSNPQNQLNSSGLIAFDHIPPLDVFLSLCFLPFYWLSPQLLTILLKAPWDMEHLLFQLQRAADQVASHVTQPRCHTQLRIASLNVWHRSSLFKSI